MELQRLGEAIHDGERRAQRDVPAVKRQILRARRAVELGDGDDDLVRVVFVGSTGARGTGIRIAVELGEQGEATNVERIGLDARSCLESTDDVVVVNLLAGRSLEERLVDAAARDATLVGLKRDFERGAALGEHVEVDGPGFDLHALDGDAETPLGDGERRERSAITFGCRGALLAQTVADVLQLAVLDDEAGARADELDLTEIESATEQREHARRYRDGLRDERG